MISFNIYSSRFKTVAIFSFYLQLLPMCVAFDCAITENIECNCLNDSVLCVGNQENATEMKEIFANLSSTFSSKTLVSLSLKISNLEFGSNFTFGELDPEFISLSTKLAFLPDDLFSEYQSSARNLSLQHNNLAFIRKQFFSRLGNLHALYLDNNILTELDPYIFYNLSKLEYLSLANNKIEVLDNNVLNQLPSLKSLILDGNPFSHRPDCQSSTVTHFSITNASLTGTLGSIAFSGMPALQSLNLSLNNLQGIQSYALSELSSLVSLYVSNNIIEYLQDTAFSALTSLEILDLKNNRISLMKTTSFSNLTKLRSLDLSGNLLDAILCEYTTDLVSLESLNLKNNRLKTVTAGSFQSSPNLHNLFFEGNPFECTCGLFNFVGFLSNSSNINPDVEAVCSSPQQNAAKSLLAISFESMNCVHVTVDKCEIRDLEDDYSSELPDITLTSETMHTFTSPSTIVNKDSVSSTQDDSTIDYNSTDDTSAPLPTKSGTETSSIYKTTQLHPTTVEQDSFTSTTLSNTYVESLTVTILNHTLSDHSFCLKWRIEGDASGLLRCSVQITGTHGRKSKNLTCPKESITQKQCIPVQVGEGFDFCIIVYKASIKIRNVCHKIENVISNKQKMVLSTESWTPKLTTKIDPVVEITTNSFVLATPKLNITQFEVVLNQATKIVTASWLVNEDIPVSVCNLTLEFYLEKTTFVEGLFGCSNNSHEILDFDVNVGFKVCLIQNHESQELLDCRVFQPNSTVDQTVQSSSVIHSNDTKSTSYQNPSLIVVICLLVIVILIIICLTIRNLLKTRTESDTYNVFAVENNVQKRTSRIHHEPSVRYSYTTKETLDL